MIRTRDTSRRLLLEIFQSALDAVNGRRRVREFLGSRNLPSPVYLIALGKVSCAMARGAVDALGTRIVSGFVVTKYGHAEPLPWPVIEAAHPVPDEKSVAAGKSLLRFIATIPSSAQVLVLLSGGASALVEALPPGVDLSLWQGMNEWLLASGRDIVAVNRIRKRLSLIKGGRLAQALYPRSTVSLAISDVPADDPRYIASGPLTADDSIEREGFDDAPDNIRKVLANTSPFPKIGDRCFAKVTFDIVASLSDAKQAAVEAARQRGWLPKMHSAFLAGEALRVGTDVAQIVVASAPGELHVWGGETTVQLPPQPGRGGRNQSLALSAARWLRNQPALLLAAGTDGTDGPTEDAGALVDGETIERGTVAGFDAEVSLRNADAGRFLEASGDLIRTGPTETNVMDLTLGLRY